MSKPGDRKVGGFRRFWGVHERTDWLDAVESGERGPGRGGGRSRAVKATLDLKAP